jgi:hypothetical protein
MLHWQLDCQSVSQVDPYRLHLIPNIFESEVLGPPLVAAVASLSNRRVGRHSFLLHFCTEKHHSTMSSRKEYGVDKRAQAAAQFYVECNKNPNTKLKIPAAMRAKGYSDDDASNRTLQAQVRRAAEKIETEQATASVTPPAPARASNSTSTRSNVPPACAFPLQLLLQTWLAQLT